jgi:hypothetical protein
MLSSILFFPLTYRGTVQFVRRVGSSADLTRGVSLSFRALDLFSRNLFLMPSVFLPRLPHFQDPTSPPILFAR